MSTSTFPCGGPWADFIEQDRGKATGVLEGFDRVRAQARLRTLYRPSVREYYLRSQKILFKDFKTYLTGLTHRVRAAAARWAERSGRGVIYLPSACHHKEDLAREEMPRQRVKEGLITGGPCRTWFVRGNKETRHVELKLNWGQCMHLYFYGRHRRLGFLHLRLQTWFPFRVQICCNGWEGLAPPRDRAGLRYRRRDHCLEWIEDLAGAQRLMEPQRQMQWRPLLQPLLHRCPPRHRELGRPMGAWYYGTVAESE
jgi:hypothetical protein